MNLISSYNCNSSKKIKIFFLLAVFIASSFSVFAQHLISQVALGIDFYYSLGGFWEHVGFQNGATSNTKGKAMKRGRFPNGSKITY